MNIYTLFRERSKNAGDFIISPSLEPLFSYEDLETVSARYAGALTSLGVKTGDRVIVQVDKSPHCLFLYFACLRMGAIYLPLNTAYLDDELRYFISDAEPSLIVCAPESSAFFESLDNTRVVTLDTEGQGSLDQYCNDEAFETVDKEDDDIAVILYTSGTTGRPKGAMISHGNLRVNALSLIDAWQWQTDDVMLHALPVFHIHGLFVATHLPVLSGSPIIFLPAFNPSDICRLLPHATVYMGVPTHYTRLLTTGALTPRLCRNIRLFTCGSAPLLPQTFSAFEDSTGFRIVERYGMTETGMNTSNPISGPQKPGTVGPPLPGVTVKIVDGAGDPVDVGEPGDLLIKGDNVFSGYWRLPEKTAEEFTNGFFKTGDIAIRDKDGYISIVGRNKDMIITGGLNVYPKEVEAAIDELEGVTESAVIGLSHPDFGEGVCAVIVGDNSLTEAEIINALKTRLANFKVPKWVYFESQLPRNTMGKVQKNVLREKFGG